MDLGRCGEGRWWYFWGNDDDDGGEECSTTPCRAKPRKMARNAARLAMNSPCAPACRRRLCRSSLSWWSERSGGCAVMRAGTGVESMSLSVPRQARRSPWYECARIRVWYVALSGTTSCAMTIISRSASANSSSSSSSSLSSSSFSASVGHLRDPSARRARTTRYIACATSSRPLYANAHKTALNDACVRPVSASARACRRKRNSMSRTPARSPRCAKKHNSAVCACTPGASPARANSCAACRTAAGERVRTACASSVVYEKISGSRADTAPAAAEVAVVKGVPAPPSSSPSLRRR